jgi:hypothetical protein
LVNILFSPKHVQAIFSACFYQSLSVCAVNPRETSRKAV